MALLPVETVQAILNAEAGVGSIINANNPIGRLNNMTQTLAAAADLAGNPSGVIATSGLAQVTFCMNQFSLKRVSTFLAIVFFSFSFAGCEFAEKDQFKSDMNKYYGEEAKIPPAVIQKYIKPGMSLKDARKFLEAHGFEVHGIGHAVDQGTSRLVIYEAKKQQRYKLIFSETQRVWIYVDQGYVVKVKAEKYLDGI